MAPLLVAALLATLTLSHAVDPSPPLGAGETCRIGGFFPSPPCKKPLVCLLTSFGNPPVDNPRVGKCTDLEEPPEKCSISFCSANGADAVCTTIDKLFTTCGVWPTRIDFGGANVKCPEICTLECRIPKLVASDGSMYCNLCLLQGASCDSGFKIFGPVTPPKPLDCESESINFFDRRKCCIEKMIGCVKQGERCSTGGSLVPPIPCEKGLTCVLSDFGFPAADRPTSGRCRKLRRKIQTCSVKLCSKKGPRFLCRTPRNGFIGGGVVTFCKTWATRSDGVPGPDCDFACPQFCRVQRLKASDGSLHCNLCILRQVSCKSDFMIYGPVGRG